METLNESPRQSNEQTRQSEDNPISEVFKIDASENAFQKAIATWRSTQANIELWFPINTHIVQVSICPVYRNN